VAAKRHKLPNFIATDTHIVGAYSYITTARLPRSFMVQITNFSEKWDFYKSRAYQLSLHFHVGERLTQDAVAARIPRDTGKIIPATGTDTVTGAAVGNWLTKSDLPDDRIKQWHELTGVPIAVWKADVAGFERSLRQRTGEILGWAGLVQQRATHGRLCIRPEDPPATTNGHRFVPANVDFGRDGPEVQLVWPGCIARIYLPLDRPPARDEDRRAWLIADYEGKRMFMLDPAQPKTGSAPSSRLGEATWKPSSRGGHIVLPRGAPGHVWLPEDMPLGTRFDVLLLTLALSDQPDDIRSLFDALERRWLVPPTEVATQAYQVAVRDALEAATAQLEAHDIRHSLFVQRCEVVDRNTAMEGRRD
jgi:hypothetical protein